MTVRVLLADDQELVRAGLEMIIDATDDLQAVGNAADGSEAVELARNLRPDVVLMAIRMPSLDGIAPAGSRLTISHTSPDRALRRNAARHPQTPTGAL